MNSLNLAIGCLALIFSLGGCSRLKPALVRMSQPTIQVSSPRYLVAEGAGNVQVKINLSQAYGVPVTVPFNLSGTAESPSDYTVASNEFVFSPGTTEASLTVWIKQDSLPETNESILIDLLPTAGISLDAGSGIQIVILDDDAPPPTLPSVSFASSAQSVLESAGSASIQVSLSAPAPQAVTVPFTVSGSATAADYTMSATSIQIPAGSTSATLSVSIVDDTVAESDETLILTLGSLTNATLGAMTSHTLTIRDNDTPPSIQFMTSASAAIESAGSINLSVNSSRPFSSAIAIPYTVAGTATSGVDHTLTSGTLTIPAGLQAGNLAFSIINDALNESDETLIISLSAPTNATLGSNSTHTLTIQDNDPLPTLQFSTQTATVQENVGAMNLQVNLSAASGRTVKVDYQVSGTAANPSDHNLSSGSLTFNPGQTSMTIPVTIVNDAVVEPPETLIVTLTNPSNSLIGTINSETVTIMDVNTTLPVAQFQSASSAVSEGTASTTITLALNTASASQVTVPFTLGGTASNAVDYTVSATNFTFPAGTTSASITVTPINDTLDENDETVTLTLGTPTNATLGTAQVHTLTIQDNDLPPTIQWQLASQSALESSGTVSLVATLSTASGLPVSATYTFGGTAVRNVDYTASSASGTLMIPAGSTSASVPLPLINNNTYQGARAVTLVLSNGTNTTLGTVVTHTLTITDDESPPVLNFGSASQSVAESIGTVTIPVSLSIASTLPLSAAYTVAGTATNPADHSLSAGTLTIPAGSTSGSISFTVVDDPLPESTETIILSFGPPTNASLGATPTHTVSITDNDAVVPTAQFAIASQTVAESVGAVALSVNLSAATTAVVSIPYTVSGTSTAPSDHNLVNGTLTIPAGSTSGSIALTIVNDTLDENDETLIVTLGTPTGATLGTGIVHTLTIQDNDSPPSIAWSSASQTVSETVGTVTLSVALNSPSGLAVSVPYTVSGTAQNPSDHNAASGTLMIPAGQQSTTLSFQVVADSITEGNETVVFTLGTPGNATLGSIPTHTVTISDSTPSSLQLGWAASIQSASEGTSVTLIAKLNAPAPTQVSAQITLSGTATSGSDYIVSPSTVVIPAGSSSTTLAISLIQDSTSEPTESAILTLSNPSSGVSIASGQGTFTLNITDQTNLPIVEWSKPQIEVQENVGTIQVQARLSAPSSQVVTAPYFLRQATDQSVIPGGTLTFPVGSTTASFAFAVPNNTTVEPFGSNRYIFYLANATNAQVGAQSGIEILSYDDEAPIVSFEKTIYTVSETGGSITLKALLDKPLPGTTAVTVPVSVFSAGALPSATAGVDFNIPTQNFTFQPGSTQATMVVNIVNDALAEPTEAIVLQMSNSRPIRVDLVKNIASIGISDDDSTALTVEWAPPGNIYYGQTQGTLMTGYTYVYENAGTLEFPVQLSKASSTSITIPITVVSGTAVSGTDYILNTPSVTIPAGSVSAPVSLSLINNTTFRGGGTVVLGFGTVAGVTQTGLYRLNVNIQDDDPPPSINFTNTEVTVSESAGSASIPVSLSALSAVSLTARSNFQYRFPAIQANLLTDYVDYYPQVASASSLVFAAGSTSGAYSVPILEDTISEDTEYALMSVDQIVVNGVYYPVPMTSNTVLKVTDNDPQPLVQWASGAQTVLESAGKAILTASMNTTAGKTVHVPFVLGGNATQGSDFNVNVSEVIIPEGATTGTLEIPLVVDSIFEPNKTLSVTLVSSGNAGLGTTLTHTITIQDPQTVVPSLAAFQTTVYPLVRGANCVGCHLPGGSGAFAPFASADVTEAFNAAVPRVNFADIPSSLLASKISPAVNHQGQQGLYTSMITAITQWRDGSIAAASPTPTPSNLLGSVGIQDYVQFEAGLLSIIQGYSATSTFSSSYALSVSNLSTTGLAGDLSAPMVGAYLSTAAEYCKIMIYEVASSATNKRGFDQITGLSNFTIANSSFTPLLQDQVSTKLALMFWQRSPTPAELSTLQTLVTGLKADNANISTKDLGTAMCTAIAGSVEGIDQ